MKNLFEKNLIAGAAIAAFLATAPSQATEYRAVLPESVNIEGDALTRALGRVFADKVGPGDTFSLWDGTNNKRIAKITVPDDERYTTTMRKMRKFSHKIGTIARHLKGLSSNSQSAPGHLDLLSVLHGVGDNRIVADEDIHLIIIGLPVQATHDRIWSMVRDEGKIQVPTDAAILSRGYRTPYSVAGRENALSGVYVHMCNIGGSTLLRLDEMSLRHVWGQLIRAQGGALVTWSSDMSVCVERFAAAVTKPLEIAAPDKSLPPAMMRPVWNESERIKEGERPQPEAFDVFFNADHPSVDGLIVYTGVEYEPENYPIRYDHAWCYFNSAAGRDAVQVRINVARKQFGHDPVWHEASDQELSAAGVSREDAELARDVCQFPKVGG